MHYEVHLSFFPFPIQKVLQIFKTDVIRFSLCIYGHFNYACFIYNNRKVTNTIWAREPSHDFDILNCEDLKDFSNSYSSMSE